MPEFDEATPGSAPRDIVGPLRHPDYDALVVAGRGRGRWRRAATAGVVVAVAAVAALGAIVGIARRAAPGPFTPPGPPLTSCTPGPVTPPIDKGTEIDGVDPTLRYIFGRVSHQASNGEVTATPVIFDNGVAHDIPPIGVLTAAVNSRGWAVGSGEITVNHVGHLYPALYRDGRTSPLPMPAGYDAGEATAINTRGDIVGSVYKDDDNLMTVPVLWPADRPQAVLILPTPRSTKAAGAATINDAGVIGGALLQPREIPYVWTSPSAGHALTVPAGMDGGDVWIARGNYAVGSVRHISGPHVGGDTRNVPAEWNLRTGEVRVHPGNDYDIIPWGVDAAGAYVYNVSNVGPSLIVQPGRPDITVPAPPPTVGRYPYIRGISADGHRLVGQLVDHTGFPTSGPMIWTCS